jgi:hypothetical protein
MANEITNRCKIYSILPKNHFGAHPGHTMMQPNHNNERHMAKEKSSIGSSWMDVKGAFPSVNIE